MIADSSKPNKVRKKCIYGEKRHHPKTEFTISKSKSTRLSYILEETNPFAIERCKCKKGASVSGVGIIQL